MKGLNGLKKTNKLWVNLGTEFYNKSFKKWLDDNDIKMYSTHNFCCR